MSEADDLPRVLSGRYRLEATLGHGGMGIVYRGTDLTMKRPVAVKVVRAVDGVELDDEVAGRFLREAKNTARLQHKHIIEVFDLGRIDGSGLYFVMELLQGESLAARLRREGRLSPATVVHIGRQICEGLHVAHTAGVVHRDLKPANVMLLSRAGDDDFVKVLDFGVAKSYAAHDQDELQLTHTGMLVGTVDYMAPEQIMGKPVDGRADVYALGVVLYRMLSGTAPFKETSVPALIHAHMNTLPKPLIEVASGIPNELDHVVLRCLAKNPERRFESMAELARALTHAVMPPSDGLIRLGGERGADELYANGDETSVGKAFAKPAPSRPRPAAESTESLDDATVTNRRLDDESGFEDATMKMDRPFALAPGQVVVGGGLPMMPRGGRRAPSRNRPVPSPRDSTFDGNAVSRRHHADDVTRIDRSDTKVCAMCRTVNAPHVRVCGACGVSLAMDDQDAVRARVHSDAPQTAGTPGTPFPPPAMKHVVYESMRPPGPSYPPNGPYGMPSMQGVPAQRTPAQRPSAAPSSMAFVEPPSGAVQWLPPQAPQRVAPSSMWRRFLVWTGLRSR
jgi:serine/threonine-protein kinase